MVYGMWVWNTKAIVASTAQTALFLAAAAQAQVTDLYMYVAPGDYTANGAALAAFNAQAATAGVAVWALDGDRGYFPDAVGSANFQLGVNNLVAFNKKARVNERFVGLMADNEPNDSEGYTAFHDGFSDAQLSSAAKSGVWQATQAQDREMLVRGWLGMHALAAATLHAANLRFGVTMPWWTENYYGAAVQVNGVNGDGLSPAGPRMPVSQFMMAIADDYVVMGYSTTPAGAARKVAAQAAMAAALPANVRPRLLGAMEVSPGVGAGISYADTAGKASKAVVLKDRAALLAQVPGLVGVAIEAGQSWQALAP